MKNKWDKEEIKFLIENYQSKGKKFVAENLERTINSIKGKAQHINLITYTPKKWTVEEIEFLKENYITKGCKFVCENLNRSKGSVQKKTKELKLKREHKSIISKEDLENAVKESYCFSNLMNNLSKTKTGDSFKIIRKYIVYYNIDISHFDPYKKNRENAKTIAIKFPLEHWLTIGSKIGSNNLKAKLYKNDLKKRECEKCEQGEIWRGEKISLILDHVNGVPDDNRIENLRILCPNCNAALPTHCRGHKKIEEIKINKDLKEEKENKLEEERNKNNGRTDKQMKNSFNQRKVKRPELNILLNEVNENGYCATGRKYGVSDNSIKKWIKSYKKEAII